LDTDAAAAADNRSMVSRQMAGARCAGVFLYDNAHRNGTANVHTIHCFYTFTGGVDRDAERYASSRERRPPPGVCANCRSGPQNRMSAIADKTIGRIFMLNFRVTLIAGALTGSNDYLHSSFAVSSHDGFATRAYLTDTHDRDRQ
jgi:hypothetical protein